MKSTQMKWLSRCLVPVIFFFLYPAIEVAEVDPDAFQEPKVLAILRKEFPDRWIQIPAIARFSFSLQTRGWPLVGGLARRWQEPEVEELGPDMGRVRGPGPWLKTNPAQGQAWSRTSSPEDPNYVFQESHV
jgi:hypothetical protein